MKEEEKKVWDWLAVGVVTGAALVVFVPWLFNALPGLKAEGWAAWVQAVGSIAAIATAVWVSTRERRAQVQRERDALADRIEMRAQLLRQFLRPVQFFIETEEDHVERAKHVQEATQRQSSVERIRSSGTHEARRMLLVMQRVPLEGLSCASEARAIMFEVDLSERMLRNIQEANKTGHLPADKRAERAAEALYRKAKWIEYIADEHRAGRPFPLRDRDDREPLKPLKT